ncbi:chromosome condensation regulator [Plasmodium yoelii]|uniref:Regulator of chromosome condensation n=3 Tax=Plasmodium yoelii TaxID=5861 RepID=A0AAF0B4A4_PLAYO|nr:chromosome condensation regulator [Plasmodium yoelii]EAA21287.1 Regulator of chromosome condensation, putative [Plasmodium yoelii yoelii]WBY59263.1 regulator of chromosome condensation [Plasmodium yoelii yoelii]CDU19419.1 regulator of chromosome condensation, putative [Plasmodium yoelii]VTZ80054.1 regulator of chromosome condensation, putative [Plasmodium yoelii]|eukprot:XP_729722.1 chromosome condensation regulator [Plasmodium yoelii]
MKNISNVKNTLFIFGSGECGQLPPKYCDEYIQSNPKAIHDLPSNIEEVICGSMHTIIKTKDDKIYSFGCNDMGVLGRKTFSNSTKDPEHSPTLINFSFPSKIKKITCGDNHTAILLHNGKVFIAGGFRDSFGVLGIPSFSDDDQVLPKTDKFIEVKFELPEKGAESGEESEASESDEESDAAGSESESENRAENDAAGSKNRGCKIINIVSGEDHLICLEKTRKHIFTMGNSDSCQVCNPYYSQEESEKNRIKYLFPNCYHYKDFGFLNKFKNIYCGGNNTFIQLSKSLDVYGIGRNAYGSCGVNLKDNIIKTFKKINELSNKKIKQLCGGQSFTVCLLKNNDLYIWGNREILGMEYHDDSFSPIKLDFFKNNNYIVKKLFCGTDHCLVLTENDKLFGWGTGGNEFDENSSIGVIEQNKPSEINFIKYFNKEIFKNNMNNSDLLINQIKITSFSGGSSHCALISSHTFSEKVSLKRGHDESYNEDIYMKKQKMEKIMNSSGKNDIIMNEDDNKINIDQTEDIKKKSFFGSFYFSSTKSNNKDSKLSKDEFEIDKNETSQNDTNQYDTTLDEDVTKKRKSTKNKSYVNIENPTRRQPRRSCKENISLKENANRQFYQIVDESISKKKRKTDSDIKSNKNQLDKKKESKSFSAKNNKRKSLTHPSAK